MDVFHGDDAILEVPALPDSHGDVLEARVTPVAVILWSVALWFAVVLAATWLWGTL